MGGPKALLPWRGETLLRRAVRVALGAGCQPVLAVVGPWDADLADLPVQVVPNPEAAEGMASSIRLGVAALPPEVAAVLILGVDQPGVDADLLRRLLAKVDPAQPLPVACTYSDTLGIPAVVPRHLFPELLTLRGDRGAKALLLRESSIGLPAPEAARDLDTPEDLADAVQFDCRNAD